MNTDIGASQERLRDFWTRIDDANGLGKQDPRHIVVACRRLRSRQDEGLRANLLIHLTQRAERILRPMVGSGLQNGGRDHVGEVVEEMVEAVLDLDSADGAGFEASFRGKLRLRLLDEIRRQKNRRDINQPPACDSEGQPVEPADWSSLGPEDTAVIVSVLEQLPENHRRAFQLHQQGFDCSSKDKECIASMLGVTPKTAKDWVDRATKRIVEELGRAP